MKLQIPFKISSVPRADAFHVLAAEGWLELGDHLSANEELEKLSPELRNHPQVLEIRWRIHAKTRNWDVCLDIGKAILKADPGSPVGWLRTAQAHHGLKDYASAFSALAPALEQFPKSASVKYDLACYHCLLGRLAEARVLLVEALRLGGQKLKLHAIHDPDLKELWEQIRSL